MRTINHNIDHDIVNAIYNHKLPIKPRRLQGILGLYSKTFNFHLNRLISLGILIKQKGLLSFAKRAKEQYEQGRFIIPLDERARRNIIKSTEITKKPRINLNKIKKEREYAKEQRENIYLQIVIVTAFGAEYYKPTSKVQLGMLCYDDHFNKKTMHFSSLKLKGVAVSDLVTKGPTRTDYLPNKRRNVGVGELFSYVNLSKSEAEDYIKALQNHDPPILKLIDSNSTGEPRYEITDTTLKDFIIHCIVALFEVRMMMEYVWIYKRWIRTDEKQWYNRLFGKEGKGIRAAGEYASLKSRRKELKDKDKKTRAERIKHANKVIHDLKESIKYRYNNIILSEKYAFVRNRYYLISDPLMKIVCPEFLQDKKGAAYIKF